jgi:hypothetical protein
MVTAVVVIIPWSIRNYVVMNSFVFLSTNDGESLYIGNHEGANGRLQLYASLWWGIAPRFSYLPPSEREVAASNAMMREGLQFMFTHPGKEGQLTVSKLRALYEEDAYALRAIHAPDVGKPLHHMDVIRDVANGFYFTVLAVSAGGLLYWVRRPRSAVSLPLILIGIFTLGQLPFFSLSRYHFPMLPSFCLLAAAGVEYVCSQLRRPKAAAVAQPTLARRKLQTRPPE